MSEDSISVREFERTMDSLNEKVDTGFKAIHEKLDNISPVVLEHEKKIAVLEFQSELARKTAVTAKEAAVQSKQSAAYRATAYGSASSAVVWLIIQVAAAIKRYVVGH